MMFVVFDIDGTISDASKRVHHITNGNKNWDAFYKDCVNDEPIWPIIHTCASLMDSPTCHVEFWTGRSDIVRADTMDWFGRHGLIFRPELLKMRSEGDYTPDDELKESWLRSASRTPDLVFEDRNRVVDMWRRNGILVAHVADGDF